MSEASKLVSGVPQGSVLGPLLFLLFIGDLDEKITTDNIKILKYVDDSKLVINLKTENDVLDAQNTMEQVFNWATENNMKWNNSKFQVLRTGKNSDIKENTTYFSPEYTNIVEEVDVVRDLGIYIDSDLTYSSHRTLTLKKIWKKLGWVKRTFRTRSVSFLKTAWNSLIQPYSDYGSVLVCPMLKGEKRDYEKPLKTFTKLAPECKNMNYWERLDRFKLLSSERRMERYRVTYIWKSLNGIVPSLGLEWINSGSRKGWHIKYPKIIAPEGRYRTLHRNSIHWEGIRVFNSLPSEIRLFTGSKEAFKQKLDKYLELIPDQPEVDGLIPGGLDLYSKASNSIADWPRTLGIHDDISMNSHEDIVLPNCVIHVPGSESISVPHTCV